MKMQEIKVKEDINLRELCKGFEDKGYCYSLEDSFGAFIEVDKETRKIFQYNYRGLLVGWANKGYLDIR
jgi:endo-1,4-beta-mannosidase